MNDHLINDLETGSIEECIRTAAAEGFNEMADEAEKELENLRKKAGAIGGNVDLQDRVGELESLIVKMESLLISLKEKRPFLDRHENNNLAINAMLKECDRLVPAPNWEDEGPDLSKEEGN